MTPRKKVSRVQTDPLPNQVFSPYACLGPKAVELRSTGPPRACPELAEGAAVPTCVPYCWYASTRALRSVEMPTYCEGEIKYRISVVLVPSVRATRPLAVTE